MGPTLFALGFVSLLGQVALLRELGVAFYGSELITILALGAWMLGTATGALGALPRLRPARRGERDGAAADGAGADADASGARRLLLACAILLVAALAWTRGARVVLGGVRGGYLPFPAQLCALALALLPPAFAMGLLFQQATRGAIARGRSLAWAYAIESAGALAGGLAATLALRAGLANLVALLLGAAAATALARPRSTLARVWAALLLAGLVTAPWLDRVTTGWSHPGLLATRDTPYGRVTLSGWDGQVNVFVNDALAYETGGTAAEEFVTLVALQHPSPRRVLVLGGGTAGLIAQALRHGPAELVSVELDEALRRLLVAHLPDSLRAPLADPRVRAVADDPRRYLERSSATWDLILVGMPEPASGQANRFYTREFFAACAARLAPGGVLGLRLPLAENYWTPQLVRRTASIEAALRASFPHALLLPGATAVLAASDAPLSRDARRLEQRYVARGLQARLATPAYVAWLVTNERVDEIAAQTAAARAPVNTDARPACYQYTLMLWLAKFYPALARLDPARLGARDGPPWARVAGLALLAVAWLVVRRPAARRAVAVAAAGGIGMVMEALLLLAWQARRGVLYQDLGLLLMLFMAGLTLGALGIDRLHRARPRLAAARLWTGRPAGCLLLAVIAGACLWLAARLRAPGGPGPVETGAWLAAAGALTAAVFAHASRQAADPARAAGPLYAADLAGGCLGSVAAALLLVPIAGLADTALLLVWVAVAAAFWI